MQFIVKHACGPPETGTPQHNPGGQSAFDRHCVHRPDSQNGRLFGHCVSHVHSTQSGASADGLQHMPAMHWSWCVGQLAASLSEQLGIIVHVPESRPALAPPPPVSG